MTGTMRVLHLFDRYLTTTQSWAFRMIDNLPDVDIVIGSKYFQKNNFYPSRFEYIEFPLKYIDQYWEKFSIFNMLVYGILYVVYPRYLAKMAGSVDLMHSHFSFVGWEFRSLAKRLKKPHIVSFYGYDYECLPVIRPQWRRRYRILFKNADLFLCEGRHGAQILEKIGCPRDKIKIARLGVAVQKIPFFRRHKKPGELRLLQIATFTEKKGHIYTVNAFIKALRDSSHMTLTFVGKAYEGIKEKVQQIARENHAENKVTFIENVDFDHLYDFMRDYQVFIHPSCYASNMDCEGGAPVVLLDAQATGMPVISTTHCDISDEVVHDKTGLLTPEKDDETLSQSIKRFYEMGNDEFRQFSEAARRHVEANYDAVRNSAELVRIYRDLIERHRSGLAT